MEPRCKQICSCLSDSKDPEDVKRQAYRVVECSFYTKKTAPSFLNHCFKPKTCQKSDTQDVQQQWKKKCETECEGTMPDGKMQVQRCCHASFPVPSYKSFRCDAKGDSCTVRNDAGAPVRGSTTPTSGPGSRLSSSGGQNSDVAGKSEQGGQQQQQQTFKELSKVPLSKDVEKRMMLKEMTRCVSAEAKGPSAVKCPVRKVRNCEGECEDEIVPVADGDRCKELCPGEIVPLKKRQVYSRCGGMIPGYGGHVPGYSICTLGNSYTLETERCLKRVISDERLNSIARKCNLADTKIIFVVGGPGSGKGTQCDMLNKRFNLTHLSSGDLLRAEVDSGSPLGKSLLATMERGELVTLETVLDILEAAMMKALKNGTQGFLIDGYPREVEQGMTFARKIRDCDVVLFFDAKDETMTERLLKRALTSGRADDNHATIKLRLKTFHEQTRPVVNFYQQRGKLIHVDAERHPQIVFGEIVQRLSHFGF